MMIGGLTIFSLILALSEAQASEPPAHSTCTEKLLNSDSESLIVMSPRGSVDSKKYILAMIDRESREKGFQVFLGLQFLKDNWTQNRYGKYRFVQVIPLAGGQVQAYVYEGRITSFVRQGREAKIVLKSASERVILRIGNLDPIYFM